MRTIPINEILTMTPGEVVPQTKGIVKAIFERKTGSSAKGPWSVQPIVLKDGDKEIIVKLWGRDEIDRRLKDQQVWLIASQSGKKIVGLTVAENMYNGEKEIQLKASEKCSLVLADKVNQEVPPPQAQTAAPTKQADKPPEQAAGAVQTQSGIFCTQCGQKLDSGKCLNDKCPAYVSPEPPTESGNKVEKAIVAAKRTLAQKGSLMALCALETKNVVIQFRKACGLPVDEQFIKATVEQICMELMRTTFTTLFISGEKKGLDMELPFTGIDEVIRQILAKRHKEVYNGK